MSFNPLDFVKNLQEMQGKMGEVQEKLKDIEAEGSAGGGLVSVKMNGQMEITGVTIDPLAVDPRDVKMLEELIVSASTAASVKVREKIKEEVSGMAGMPPGFPGINL